MPLSARSTLAALAAIALTIFTGCAATVVETEPPPAIIGGVFGVTGMDAALDLPTMHGAELAVQELNDAGVLKRVVKLQVADCKSDSAGADSAVKSIASSHEGVLIGYVGLSDSDPALGAGIAATGLSLPFVTAGATLPRLPQRTGPSMFLACFGDNVQAAAGAEFARNILNKRRVFLLFNRDYTYTNNLALYFHTRWEQFGGPLATGELGYSKNQTDYASEIAVIKATAPDFIYAASMPEDVTALTQQLRAAGLTMPIVGGDGWDIPTLAADLGAAGDSVYYTTHAFMGDTAASMKKFSASYKAKFGVEPENAFAALGYDAVMLLADAAKRNGTLDNGMKTIAALEATHNFAGVTGSISFTVDDHVPKKTVSIIGIMNGAAGLETAFVPTSIPLP